MRFIKFCCVYAYKCTYVRRKMIKLTLYTNGNYEPESVPDISKKFQSGCSILCTGFCRFTRNSSCPGISPQRCLAHIIAKSYHFRTVIQLSRYTRENIPQGVTFKTPIFVRFFKTFFKKLKVCSVAQKRPSLGRHFESLKKRLFMKLFYFR